MYGFDLYFCFIDFMLCFTDFMVFHRSCLDYRHGALQTFNILAEYFQKHHPYMDSVYLFASLTL